MKNAKRVILLLITITFLLLGGSIIQAASTGAGGSAGTRFSTKTAVYKITKSGKEVSYMSPVGTRKTIRIPATVKRGGITYKVTGIAKKAFSKNTVVTKVTIGKNVKTIGKYAFSRTGNLKSLTIKTTKLDTGSVADKAFSKAGFYSYKSLVVTVPSSKKDAYVTLLKEKGLSAKASIRSAGTDSSETAADSSSAIASLSVSQIKEKVIAHYTALWKPDGTFNIFDSETTTTSSMYRFILRVALTNGRSANTLVTMITVNRSTGLVSDGNGYANSWYLK